MPTDSYKHFRELLSRGDGQEAVRLAERELVSREGSSEFWLTQLSLALTRARQPRRAIDAAERALALAPTNAYALLARADALRAEDRLLEALADYEEVFHLPEERARPRAAKGALDCLCRLGDWRRVLDLLPGWLSPSEGRRWRVTALAGLGRSEEALAACEEWLCESPDNPEALWQLTEIEVGLEGLDAVLDRMAKIAKIPSRSLIYREIYASLCRRAGKEDLAAAQYEKLAAASSDPKILRKQAFSMAKNKQEQAAIPLMEELLRLNPADPYVHSAYGAACERAGQLDRAWSFYHALLGLYPTEKGLFGRIRGIRGRMERAPKTTGEGE